MAEAARQVATLLPDEEAMLTVPLLVHGAETGDPRPAVPVSAMHLLWWTSAHVFDDVIDGGVTHYSATLTSGAAVMASVVCGSTLPVDIARHDVPLTIRADVLADFFTGWTLANDGQIRDLRGVTGGADLNEVLDIYRRKTGAPYGAACSMAARLAGASESRAQGWWEFGAKLGTVGQLRNDQEDMVTGRDEDLINGTATYLLLHLLNTLPEQRAKDHVRTLAERARHDARARAELKDLMIGGETGASYLEQMTRLGDEAHQALDALHLAGEYVDGLHRLVTAAATPVPGFLRDSLVRAG
jgi:heptaprenyl diphosphate synthase